MENIQESLNESEIIDNKSESMKENEHVRDPGAEIPKQNIEEAEEFDHSILNE